jgi:hypothetical protein
MSGKVGLSFTLWQILCYYVGNVELATVAGTFVVSSHILPSQWRQTIGPVHTPLVFRTLLAEKLRLRRIITDGVLTS